MDVELHATTGIKHLDDLLRHLITLFERSFPTRIRSYYLGGSYSDGTAVGHDHSPNSSDVDLQNVVYRDNEIMTVLETLVHDTNETVQTSADKVLEILELNS